MIRRGRRRCGVDARPTVAGGDRSRGRRSGPAADRATRPLTARGRRSPPAGFTPGLLTPRSPGRPAGRPGDRGWSQSAGSAAGPTPAAEPAFLWRRLMLTPGNKKLGGRLIWGFGLPSGTAAVCVAMTPACRRHCYAVRTEAYRPGARARYARNLALSRLPDFAQRVRYFILNHDVEVVRVHTGGEFYSAAYARKWLRVMRALPGVRFFFYTRSWRVAAIRPVLERMAALPNCRAWFSCDRDPGLPAARPPGARPARLV